MTKDAISRFTFRLPKALFEQVKSTAENQGVSINAFILQILWEWAKKNNRNEVMTEKNTEAVSRITKYYEEKIRS